jgi:hypothetical protein
VSRKRTRTVLTLFMNVLFAVALVLVARIVVLYFGVLSSLSVTEVFVAFSDVFVIPLGLPDVHTLWGGVFDLDAAFTVGMVLVAEWGLSVWRSRI